MYIDKKGRLRNSEEDLEAFYEHLRECAGKLEYSEAFLDKLRYMLPSEYVDLN